MICVHSMPSPISLRINSMSDLELCYLPATEAIARFKAKPLSPVELLAALIRRAEEVEPVMKKLNGFRSNLLKKRKNMKKPENS